MILLHAPLSPFGRLARLVIAELGAPVEARSLPAARMAAAAEIEAAGAAALSAGVDPQCDPFDARIGPILIAGESVSGGGALSVGGVWAVVEYLDELGQSADWPAAAPDGRVWAPWPSEPAARAEARRLTEWAGSTFWRLAVEPPFAERFLKAEFHQGGPDMNRVRAASAAARRALADEAAALVDARGWLADDRLTVADFALAAQISVLDYLGDRPFDAAGEDPLRDWYALIKSRPSFHGLLADRAPRLPPSASYGDLDF
ncbi:MAG: glutathione S-transferase family protein [Pseudomonadota bacterium]